MSDSLSLDVLKAKADALAQEINIVMPDLTVMYVIHRQGQLMNTLTTMEGLILEHPAGATAHDVLRRTFPEQEPSSLLGVVATMTSPFLAMHHDYALLALVSINADSYKTFEEALIDLYRQTWKAIEAARLLMDKGRTVSLRSDLFLPKFDLIGESRSNMCADIFSVFMMHSEGYDDTLDRVARTRCRDILRKSTATPQFNPFLLVKDTTQFALNNMGSDIQTDIPRLDLARDFTLEISDMTTDRQIQHWWRFCLPAQDMVWCGVKPDVVLGAALYTCEDPYIRSIVHLVTDTIDVKPLESHLITSIYNPFIDSERNFATHIKMVHETFDNALAQAVSQNDSEPLYAEANRQNLKLLEGNFLGWCASSLQAAARSFDQALAEGKPAAQSAKLEFESARSEVTMDNLRLLTSDIIKMKKVDSHISVAQVLDLCMRKASFATISRSIDTTVTSLQKRRGGYVGADPASEYHSYFIIDESEDFLQASSSATWTTSMTKETGKEQDDSEKTDLEEEETSFELDE